MPGARDTLRDWDVGGDADMLDLSAIDAVTGGTDDAFTFVGTAQFSGTAGELRFQSFGSDGFVMGDTDGDRATDVVILLSGVTTMLDAGDFVL